MIYTTSAIHDQVRPQPISDALCARYAWYRCPLSSSVFATLAGSSYDIGRAFHSALYVGGPGEYAGCEGDVGDVFELVQLSR